jgi:DNA-binding transcriptional LysR family regulator
MELRHLRYFVAVAEELHFGRAARRMNLAQPPLSQQIRALEAELGLPLFLRTSRKVALTEAGHLFLQHSRLVLAQADHARNAITGMHRGETGRLTIGFVSSAMYSLVPAILREFNRRRPKVEIRCLEMTGAQQEAAFKERQIQIAFTRNQSDGPHLHRETLITERFVLALPTGHPLARRVRPRLRDFANEGFILFSRTQGSAIYDGIIASCQRAGFSPRISQEGGGVQTILALVAAGLGVAMVPASLQNLQRPGVVYRALPRADSQEVELALVWRQDDRSAATEAFLQIARETARTLRPTSI